MEKYETVIVGAGPAGLKCAETLAKEGREVLVLEKDNVFGDKVCAGGLSVNDFELGISEKIVDKKFKKTIIHTPLQKILISQDVFIATVDRKVLGKFMAKQAEKAGAEIRKNSKVEKIYKNYIVLANGAKIGFEYLVGAGGSNSLVRQSLGLKDKNVGIAFQYITKKKFKNMEFFIDYNKFGPWYAWIFPHKNYTSIGTGGDGKMMSSSNLKKNLNKLCKDKFDIKKAKFEAFPIRSGYRGFKFKNKFLVGDAAGFASAWTGEGIYFGILSGIDVAKKIINPRYKCKNIEHILKIKKRDKMLLKHWKKHKILTEIEFEFLTFMSKSKWICNELLKRVE